MKKLFRKITLYFTIFFFLTGNLSFAEINNSLPRQEVIPTLLQVAQQTVKMLESCENSSPLACLKYNTDPVILKSIKGYNELEMAFKYLPGVSSKEKIISSLKTFEKILSNGNDITIGQAPEEYQENGFLGAIVMAIGGAFLGFIGGGLLGTVTNTSDNAGQAMAAGMYALFFGIVLGVAGLIYGFIAVPI